MEVENVFNFYVSDRFQDVKNCLYPYHHEVKSVEDFIEVAKKDHVCVLYKDNYRSKERFIKSNVHPGDVDNHHTENPAEWITKDILHQMFAGVPHIIVESRHHMLQKDGFSPRPRYHIFFICNEETDHIKYVDFNKRVLKHFPFFDSNAIDAARLLFGVEKPNAWFYSGTITLDEFIEGLESEEDFDAHLEKDTTIHEGSRNSTMFQYAVCILKKYGDTDETYEKFLVKADQCETPLPDSELSTIWRSANKYYESIKKQPGYIAPEIYNDTTPQWEQPIQFDEFNLPEFPIHTLPPIMREYVIGVAETTQTPIDMPATSALAIAAMCMVLSGRDNMMTRLKENIEQVLLEEDTSAIEEIDAKLEELQQELIKKASARQDYEDLADEIDNLREQRLGAMTEKAEREGLKMRIQEMKDFLENQTDRIGEYDEQLVRKMIEKITIYDDKFVIEFKSGTSMDVRR